ncbi:MAG: hypothetical protein DWQ02_14570 [Bacteroidetes bacterium]|nr:MAG: hypothetical protein DWQ02_14570 [Bacteroidota bacterium]
MKTTFVKLLPLILFFFITSTVFAQEQRQDSTQVQVEADKLYLEAVDKILELSRQEMTSFRQGINGYLKTGAWILGGALAVFGFLGYKNIWDVRERMEKRAIEKSDKILTEKFESFVGEKVSFLQRQIDLGLRYQNSKVLFIGSAETIKQWDEFEMELLRKSGLDKLTTSEATNHSYLDVDVVVYRYEAMEGGDEKLSDIVERLKQRNQPIPLIVYTGTDRMIQGDKKMLEEYGWFVLSNMPLTMLNHIYNAANLFHSVNSH